jgi:hypothetical protein
MQFMVTLTSGSSGPRGEGITNDGYEALALPPCGAQVAKQDTAGAIASLEKALTIEPNNAAARRQLDQLRK